MIKIAIIGSGISGLSLACKLNNKYSLTIFEKSRTVSGRLATKKVQNYYFDHGAQYFTAKNKDFIDFLKPLIEDEIIKPWDARFSEFIGPNPIRSVKWDKNYPHYVGVPNMNSIGKYIARNFEIRLNTKVNKVIFNDKKKNWHILDEKNISQGQFEWIVFTQPPLQTLDIIANDFKFLNNIKNTEMLPCYSLMLGYKEKINLDFDAALVREADISWISINSSKPLKNDKFSLVIHSTNKWAKDNIEKNNQEVDEYLFEQTSKIINRDLSNTTVRKIHKWRFANIVQQSKIEPFVDYDKKIAVCGDWCIQGRVEAGFLSGFNLANSLN